MSERREEVMFLAQDLTQDIVRLVRSNPDNPIAALIKIKDTLMDFYNMGLGDAGTETPVNRKKSVSEIDTKAISHNIASALVGILAPERANEVVQRSLYDDLGNLLEMLYEGYQFMESGDRWWWSSPRDPEQYFQFRESKTDLIPTLIQEELVKAIDTPDRTVLELTDKGRGLVEDHRSAQC